jgi:hypothetical protein
VFGLEEAGHDLVEGRVDLHRHDVSPRRHDVIDPESLEGLGLVDQSAARRF